MSENSGRAGQRLAAASPAGLSPVSFGLGPRLFSEYRENVQGVRKLIAHFSSPFDNETKRAWVMVYLPIYPPPNRTHSLIRSGMPFIRLYSVSALMLSHARWRFLITACSVVAGSIMSSSLCMIARKFSRSGLLSSHTPLSQKPGRLSQHHR